MTASEARLVHLFLLFKEGRMSMKEAEAAEKPSAPNKPTTGPTVRFDDSEVTNTYANVCNVSSSREEVVLVFGLNNAWERDASEVRVKLNSRVILSAFAAKRLSLLLNRVVYQYEARFGAMDVGSEQIDKVIK
jgi:uncharacterized protein DUF3467